MSQAQHAILLVAFGTRRHEALPAYQAVEAAFRRAFPAHRLVWAYTSRFIRSKLAEQGAPVLSVAEALAECAAGGIRRIRVQSLHVVAGEEFSYLERVVLTHALRHPGRFDAIAVGRPLMESGADLDAVLEAVCAAFPDDRAPDEAVVLMGHGHAHGRGDLVFRALAAGLRERDPLVFFASVEGDHPFSAVLEALKNSPVRRVWLQPFMLVAGEHAVSDLTGDNDASWASQLAAAGFEVRATLRGLGELPGVQAVFVRHAEQARENITDLKDGD
jgi:Cobalamin biosynthesis protein CbiK, Co2+ chelatase